MFNTKYMLKLLNYGISEEIKISNNMQHNIILLIIFDKRKEKQLKNDKRGISKENEFDYNIS